MNRDDATDFDDPALRAALRRAFDGDAAPAHLRGRIELALAGAGPTLVPAERGGWQAGWERWRDTVYSSIAAAVLALGIGLVVLHYKGAFDPRPEYGSAYPIDADLPEPLAQAILEQHVRGMALGVSSPVSNVTAVSTSTGPATKDLTTITTELSRRLGFPVLAADPGEEWTLIGAGTCPIGPFKGAHLMFRRGDDTISIFALPAGGTLYRAPDNARYAAMIRGQPIAGFKRGAGLYVAVGFSPEGRVMLSDVLLTRGRLQGNDALPGCSTSTAPVH